MGLLTITIYHLVIATEDLHGKWRCQEEMRGSYGNAIHASTEGHAEPPAHARISQVLVSGQDFPRQCVGEV